MTEQIVNSLPPLQTKRPSVIAALRIRDFRLLWIGQGISILGDQFYLVALPWLTLELTGSGLALGTVLMVAGIPRALLLLITGAITDRRSPRALMLASNIARAALIGVLTLLVLSDGVQLWQVYAIAFLFGVADAFFYPAFNSILPRLVGSDLIESGNALLQITTRLGVLIGPAVAGIMIGQVGTGSAFAIDTLTFIAAALALVAMRSGAQRATAHPEGAAGQARPSLLGDIRESLRYVWNDPPLRALILMLGTVDLIVTGPISVGLPSLAEYRFEGGATALGWMLSAFGGGALVGAFYTGSVQIRDRGRVLLRLIAVFGVSFLVIGAADQIAIVLIPMILI